MNTVVEIQEWTFILFNCFQKKLSSLYIFGILTYLFSVYLPNCLCPLCQHFIRVDANFGNMVEAQLRPRTISALQEFLLYDKITNTLYTINITDRFFKIEKRQKNMCLYSMPRVFKARFLKTAPKFSRGDARDF